MGRDTVAQDRSGATRASAGMSFDVAQIDEVLATTRAVRRRLDLERPVDNQLLLDCIELAEQAPTGGNLGSRRWVIVREQRVKDQLGELYRDTALPFMSAAAERLHGTGHPSEKVMASATYLAEHLAEVPAIVIPTVNRTPRRQRAPRPVRLRHPGGLELLPRPAGPRARHHLGHRRAAGHREGQGDPPHTGRHDRDRPPPGRLHEGHRLQARPAPPRPVDHLLRPLWPDDRARPQRRAALRGRSRRHRRGRHRRLASHGWSLVSDINLPARFSNEFAGAEWASDNRGVGAMFHGRNQHAALGEWTIPCFIDTYDQPRAFGWRTSDPDNPGARWRFDLEPREGGTRLRFSYVIGPGPSGTTMAITNNPGKEVRVLRRRIGEVQANMQQTVEGVKQLAETAR
jgi:nitroreductase